MSRNSLVVDACRALLQGRRRSWPPELLTNDQLTDAELEETRDGGCEMWDEIQAARVDRVEPLSLDAGVATPNARHFREFEGLTVADWSR